MKNTLYRVLFLSMLTGSNAIAAKPQDVAKAAPAASFDLAKVPLSQAALPPFPYIAAPPGHTRKDKVEAFDRAYVIAGNQLRQVEGRVARRAIYNPSVELSDEGSRRNHEAAIKALGGVKVDVADFKDPALRAPNESRNDVGEKLGMPRVNGTYDTYLIRTKDTNIWFGVAIAIKRTSVTIVEEKPMTQTVGFVSAGAMRDALNRDGHVALYINFDTDKASIREDGKPAVAEIASLLKSDPALKLSIEGHTDNSGDAKRNQTLSRERAGAVMAAVVNAGVDGSRLRAAGHGAARPLADNSTEEGKAKNRRVELVKVKPAA